MWGCKLYCTACVLKCVIGYNLLPHLMVHSQSTLTDSKTGPLHALLYSKWQEFISHQGLNFLLLSSSFTGHAAKLKISRSNFLHTLVKPAKPVRLMAWGGFWREIRAGQAPWQVCWLMADCTCVCVCAWAPPCVFGDLAGWLSTATKWYLCSPVESLGYLAC